MDTIILPAEDSKLLLECEISTYRASGKGGQHVNVTNSAVRLLHRPTGLVVTCQNERSQYLNKQECLRKLRKWVEKLNYRKPKRFKTKLPHSVKLKNKESKIKQSQKINWRRKKAKPEED